MCLGLGMYLSTTLLYLVVSCSNSGSQLMLIAYGALGLILDARYDGGKHLWDVPEGDFVIWLRVCYMCLALGPEKALADDLF